MRNQGLTQINRIPLIEVLKEIEKKKLTETVIMVAKKFLPDTCVHRASNSFSFDILLSISRMLLEDKEINDLRHICCQCEFISLCGLYKN